jgi:hypothetical protein
MLFSFVLDILVARTGCRRRSSLSQTNAGVARVANSARDHRADAAKQTLGQS